MRALIVTCSCLAALAAPVAAQHQRVYVTYPLSLPNPFQAPSPAQLGGTLSGRVLPLPGSIVMVTPRADTIRARVRKCPMPVLKPDTSRLERMRIVKTDSARTSSMPVLRPDCVNPLNP